jgi:hypothetical protein
MLIRDRAVCAELKEATFSGYLLGRELVRRFERDPGRRMASQTF